VLTSDDVGRLLRAAYATERPHADERVVERVMARIEASETARPAPTAKQRGPGSLTWRSTTVLIVLLALIGAIAVPSSSWAGFPLSRLIGFDGVTPKGTPGPRVIPGAIGNLPTAVPRTTVPPDTPLAFTPRIFEMLPGGFTLTRQASTSPTSVRAYYEDPDGLEVVVIQGPADAQELSIAREDYELTQVDGTDVLLLRNEAFQSIAHAVWADGELLIAVRPTSESASRHLDEASAIAIIMAFNATSQDK
jgi:hypothetical protein